MMEAESPEAVFEAARPRLLGLAYRILGGLADAEDAVQDCWLRWMQADNGSIRNPAAWLTTVCTRRCIDMRRAHDRTRVDYVGAWLPEPLQATGGGAEDAVELASTLNTAFMLVMERLAPKERAAFLLHEIFDVDYAEIAGTLDIDEAACRKLVSRAKGNVEKSRSRYTAPPDRQRVFLDAFHDAVTEGETAPLAALLAQDVRLSADGGGKVPSIREPFVGGEKVLQFISRKLSLYWQGADWTETTINGVLGAEIRRDGVVTASVTFAADPGGRITEIYITRNPDKLAALRPVDIF